MNNPILINPSGWEDFPDVPEYVVYTTNSNDVLGFYKFQEMYSTSNQHFTRSLFLPASRLLVATHCCTVGVSDTSLLIINHTPVVSLSSAEPCPDRREISDDPLPCSSTSTSASCACYRRSKPMHTQSSRSLSRKSVTAYWSVLLGVSLARLSPVVAAAIRDL